MKKMPVMNLFIDIVDEDEESDSQVPKPPPPLAQA